MVPPFRVAWLENGNRRWFDRELCGRTMYSGCSAEDVAWAFAHLRPQSSTMYTEPSPLNEWPEVPITDIRGDEDQLVSPAWAAEAVPERLGVASVVIPGAGHSSMLSHPRELADLPDVEALNRLRDADVPVLLYGPPGTGKTSLVEAAFEDLLTIAGDGDTTVGDLIGEYTQDDAGAYVFQYGPLVTAMTEGRALLIDDATLISPKVLAALYPAMDGRRQIQVKAHKGETIKAEPGFYVVAGHNPGVHGAVLTEALASRFSVQIQIGTDYDLALALRIDARVVRVARHLAHQVELGELGWAPQLRELLSHQRTEAVLGTKAALANLVGIAPLEDRDAVAAAVIKAAGVKEVAPLTLGKQLPASAVRQPPGSTGSAHRGRSR